MGRKYFSKLPKKTQESAKDIKTLKKTKIKYWLVQGCLYYSLHF